MPGRLRGHKARGDSAHCLGASRSAVCPLWEDGAEGDLTGFGVSDPLPFAVLLVEAGEVKPFRFGPNHDNFAGEF